MVIVERNSFLDYHISVHYNPLHVPCVQSDRRGPKKVFTLVTVLNNAFYICVCVAFFFKSTLEVDLCVCFFLHILR